MTRKFLGAAAALMLMICGSASAATVPVTQLTGQFAATNPSVASTNDGVQFGVYPNASTGGSLYYGGANGLPLSSITDLSYTFTYKADNEPSHYTGAPFIRIFTDGPDNDPAADTDFDGDPTNDTPDVLLEASNCATEPNLDQSVAHTYQVVGYAHLRVGDDGCSGLTTDKTWADVLASQGASHITGIYITTGFSVGENISALVTHLTVNGTDYCFNCAQPTPVITNTFVTEPSTPTVNSAASKTAETCKGNTLRTLHALKRPGQKILSVRATLRGKRLKVKGRTITADLRKQPEANYNVRLTVRYRTKSGRIVTVKTTRNLSVVCA
jgi:hypothetical protein